MEPTFNDADTDMVVETRPSWRKKALVITGAVLVLVLVLLYFTQGNGDSSSKKQASYAEVLELSNNKQDQTALQNFFVEKVAAGINDQETRSAIHWIAHRYFDNGGNIYEIFDFINAHPEVAFLKDAEGIYPEIFAKIYLGEVPKVFSYDSLYALLAYYETIDRYGYGDIAIWGTAANKYAELNYWGVPENEAEMNEEYLKFYEHMLSRATYYTDKVRVYIVKNATETGTLEDLRKISGVLPDDLLVGLNQYASALANMQGFGATVQSDFSIFEIFEFNSKYAEEKVPRLYLFTNYLFATSLTYSGKSNRQEVAIPLDRFVSYTSDINNWGAGTVLRVIQSKDRNEKGVFDHEMTKILADAHPGFKQWLIERGWTEADLKI